MPGKLATGIDSNGIATGGAASFAVSPPMYEPRYGTASAAMPSRAVAVRKRRLPRPLSPDAPSVPELGPAAVSARAFTPTAPPSIDPCCRAKSETWFPGGHAAAGRTPCLSVR